MYLVLAFLIFQEDPLPRNELINLLEHSTTRTTISSAIDNLMPVIAEFNSEYDSDDYVRCNHKSFSDILKTPEVIGLQKDSSKARNERDAFYRRKKETFHDTLLPELTEPAQCLRLAKACLLALDAEFKFQCSSPYEEAETTNRETDNIPPFLPHASEYWRKYSELAGEESNNLPLHPYKHALRWMESFSLIDKENDSESGQQKDFITRFETCQESLDEGLRRRDRDAGGPQTPHHLAESEHHGILVDPGLQLGDEARKSNSTDIQEAERRELEQLLGPCFQVLPNGCHGGTRVSILDRIKKWVKDSVPANPNAEFVGESANSSFAGQGAGPRNSPTSFSNGQAARTSAL
ncbi:hypothetical protein SCHPADRAFT_929659 [Schizopora paradoxa]|uniref:Uncharacterized protein n=1 Tax=Schizopora paradoxa TaxID=27342 RepID=A0A0H2S475_9AGAM|nr:hypothetical protein SCHPADRAFT_929659 [Schizopora paradoxa]